MLAIFCDLETDITNHRYTLVHYIGKKQALVVYHIICDCVWCDGACGVACAAPWTLLGVLAVGVPAYKHIQQSSKFPRKENDLCVSD